MTTDTFIGKTPVARWHCYLLLAASLLTLLLITMGGIVCVTESGAGCPDWPGCFGQMVPPLQAKPIIEYLHRLVAALTSPLIIAGAVASWRRARELRWLSRPSVLAIAFLVAVIIFGAFAVLRGLPPGVAALDLGSALIVLTLMLTATVVAFAHRANPDLPDRLRAGGTPATSAITATIAVFFVYVGGILTAGPGSLTRCLGWPLWRLLPADRPGWPQYVRLALAAGAIVLIAVAVIQAWRAPGYKALQRWVAACAALALVVEMAAGLAMLAGSATVSLVVLYVVSAAVLWAALVVMAVLAALAAAATERRADAAQAPAVTRLA